MNPESKVLLPLPVIPATAKGSRSGLPLPKGEGWGEGEGSVRQPIVCTHAHLAHPLHPLHSTLVPRL
jgi:hypothetical protein